MIINNGGIYAGIPEDVWKSLQAEDLTLMWVFLYIESIKSKLLKAVKENLFSILISFSF